MLSKMSKSDKTMFYYLGLSLLVLIVLGVVFGVSSVKESFGGFWKRQRKIKRKKMTKCCVKARPAGEDKNSRKDWCKTDIKNGAVYPTSC